MNNGITSSKSRATRIAVAALALCMATGGALAQGRPGDDRGDNRGRGNDRHEQQRDRHDNRGNGHGNDRHDDRRYERQDFRPGSHFDRRGYQPRPAEWRRGGRLPPEYRGRNYVVNDYRAYRLQPPPRGYQWIGIGGEFALAAIATGLIAQIIISQ
jgi:Ni/Co efflux regulator RcnB